MAVVAVLAIVIIAFLYPLTVIAEDGTNLNPSPIQLMALEADNSIPMVVSEHHVTKVKESTKIVASISEFTSAIGETDDTPDITASGKHVHKGTAACPSRFSFGTQIVIAGQTYTCEDRMNERYQKGNYFDIWSSSRAHAINFGRQKLVVEVLQ